MTDTIAGHLVWKRGLRGFYAEKHPASYQPPADAPPPVDRYPLGADEFAMKIAILEIRYPCRAKLEDETKTKIGEPAQ